MSQYLRRQGRVIQAPQLVYSHLATGRRVTLIGMVHVAEPRFYDEVKVVVANCEANGAVVHAEGSGKTLAEEVLTGITEAEAEVIRELQRGELLKAHRLPLFGWADQNMAMLPYPDSWQFIDLSRLDVIRLTGTDVLMRTYRDLNNLMDWAETDTKKPHLCRLSIAMGFRKYASNSRRVQKKLDLPEHRVLVDQRNKVAMAAVHGSAQDVVLVWGTKHLPGMEEDLREHGFVRVDEFWRTVFQLPSLVGSLWGMFRGRPLKVASSR